jgi:hypothetical protein
MPKKPKFKYCYACAKIREENFESALRNKIRNHQERLVRDSQKLPAKNRRKSAIIDALLQGKPIPPSKRGPSPSPKTKLYRNLEDALVIAKILKDLENF